MSLSLLCITTSLYTGGMEDEMVECFMDFLLLCLQLRTPALVFEHVNNTDFKVIQFHFHSQSVPSLNSRCTYDKYDNR